MRSLILAIAGFGFLSISACTTDDPDLNPQSSVPPSERNKKAWSQPISGQGGGALGALPDRPRR